MNKDVLAKIGQGTLTSALNASGLNFDPDRFETSKLANSLRITEDELLEVLAQHLEGWASVLRRRVKNSPQPTSQCPNSTILEKSVIDLKVKVRARKMFQKLNISTVGDLINHSAKELLKVKNFKQTSLNELRMVLKELGLKLKDDE
jgi:DNA-directed RNA polymerase alpha subunit